MGLFDRRKRLAWVSALAVLGCAGLGYGQTRVFERLAALGGSPFGAGASASAEGIHIQSDRQTNFSWTMPDSKGGRWDIYNDGRVSNGINNAYDSGMQLQVNSQPFQNSNVGRLSKDGNEVEIGPWRVGNVSISRRIFINAQGGYCRWIDIFENTSDAAAKLPVRYYSNMGDSSQQVVASSGAAAVTEKDWAAATWGPNGSSRPAVAHVFASPHAAVRPRITLSPNDDNIYLDVALDVPSHKAVALCVFEAQRPSLAVAGEFIKGFKPSDEIRGLPAALRRIILNIADPGLLVGGIEIRREEAGELVVLRNGDEMRGTVANDKFALKTAYGAMELPAGKVFGMISLSGESARMHLVLEGGQVLAGELADPIVLRLQGGTELKLPAGGVRQVGYRISPQKPEQLAVTDPLLVLRAGERLALEPAGGPMSFLTPFGTLALSPGDLAAINLDMPSGALHQALFRNGSALAGLLTEQKLSFKLKLGPTLQVAPENLSQMLFPAAAIENTKLACVNLRNGDALYGQLADKRWTVKNEFGNDVEVACDEIRAAEFSSEAFGQVKVTLENGSQIGGRLASDYVNFKIEPGPAVKLFIGHATSLSGAANPAATAATTTASAPTTTRAVPAAAAPEVQLRRQKLQQEIAELENQLESLQRQHEIALQNGKPVEAVEAQAASRAMMDRLAKAHQMLKEIQ